jgi:hypothetical protein
MTLVASSQNPLFHTCKLSVKTYLSLGSINFPYMGVKIINHLPPEIKSMSNDTKSFKLKLTTFLLQNYFYTIE